MINGKKVGLALGGGGAKGLAHIGILKVLEENNIEIDMVSGTSFGSVIGIAHCLGYTPKEMEKISKEISLFKLFDFGMHKGLVKGEKIEKYFRNLLGNKQFSDLKKPLFITATDINNFQEIVFNKGDLVKAMRASVSVPGVFVPVENNGRFLVDGGLMDNLPIEVLKENGAEIIIAVNLDKDDKKKKIYEEANPKKDKRKVSPGILTTLQFSFNILMKEKINIFLENSNKDVILISPDLKEVKFQDFKKVDLAIKKGEEETKKQLHLIKKFYN